MIKQTGAISIFFIVEKRTDQLIFLKALTLQCQRLKLNLIG